MERRFKFVDFRPTEKHNNERCTYSHFKTSFADFVDSLAVSDLVKNCNISGSGKQ